MTVSIGSNTKLNSIAGIASVLQLTDVEKISLANKVLPPNILVRDDADVLYMTDGVSPISALKPIKSSAGFDSDGNNIVDTYATKSELNDKADSKDLTDHTGNANIHVTTDDKSKWDAKQDALTIETDLNKNSTNLITNGAVTAALEDKLDVTGIAASANKLETSRNINGTPFNGTSAITTAKWGTSRTITVTDNTSTHFTTTTTDGGADFALKLPGTIDADITGNATTATTASDYAAGGTIENALSGKALASDLNTHTSNTVAHCTQAEKNEWTAKQTALSVDQMAAVNSGITATRVGVYDGYASQIAAKVNTADVEEMISSAVADINSVEMVTAASFAALPAQGSIGTFYLVRNAASSGNNLYTEYIWTGTEYEETGANVDLKDYVTNTTLTTELGKKQNNLTTLQQDAVDSGINATRVGKYDGYESTIAGITSANNSTITIKKNGTSVGTFTTNSASDKEVDISVPTKVSDLTNDSGFISAHPAVSTIADTTSEDTPAHGGSFNVVDGVTRDSFGHVTKINVKTITLPADNNTDTLVNQSVSTTNNTYPILLTPTANASSNQGAKGAIFASGVKVNPSTGTVSATGFVGDLTGNVTGNVSGSSGSCTGNAATATQFSSNASVTLTGDVTGTVSSKKGWSVATTLANSGVIQGTYGPSENVTGNNGSTISVPEITVDAKGRVTSIVNRTYTSVDTDTNTDTKVTQNVSSVDASYPILLTPTANAATNQGAKTAIFASGVKVNPSSGNVTATSFTGSFIGDVTGNCSGTAANVTGTVAIGNGGTGATTRTAAFKNLTNENVGEGAQFFITITSNWAKAGYTTVAQAKKVLGLDSVANVNASKAISGITRSGTTFTYTCVDGTTGTFDQQDTDTTYSNMTAATASAAGKAGLVPAPAAGKQTSFLRGDGTWVVPTNTTYSSMSASEATTGTATTARSISAKVLNDKIDEKISALVASAPEALDTLNELASALGNDPNFATTISTEIGKKLDTTTASGTYVAKSDGIVGMSVSGKVITFTKGDGTSDTITTQDTNTWTAFKGATSSANGTAGYVPAPTKGNQDKFFKADGTWATPTNTTYSFTNSAPTLAWGTTSTIGTVGGVDLTVTMPANPNTDTHWTTTLYAGAKDAKSNAVTTNGNAYIKLYDNNTVRSQLNIKGSGATTVTTDANGVITISSTDNNTTYSVATTSANGLMSSADKTKLDGLSNYTLPTASSTLGGVKTTSTVTSTTGLTACPIISGVPYYKDTNTTYSAMSAAEATTGTATSARSITAKVLHDKISEMLPVKAIVGITRSGTTFTYTCVDGSTGTFTQQDNNTTYSAMTAAEATTGTATTARSITAKVLHDKISSMIPDNISAITSAEITELLSQKLAPTPTRDGAMWMDANYNMFVNEYNRV